MFEIGIICVVALAIGFCGALWVMRRRNDVLRYGDFVHTEQP